MKRSFNLRAMLLALGITSLTAAAQTSGPSVQVLEAYAPATTLRQRSAEIYARFVNVETDDQLIGADCALSRRVELVAADGSRRPFQEFHFQEDVEIGFREGATHLHLVGLKHPLVRGQSFVVTLHFAATGALTLNVIVV
jgi:copper(I)-binding protein